MAQLNKISDSLKSDLGTLIGEGFHTMLRKGIDGHGSGELWKYIAELDQKAWRGMLEYWIVDPIIKLLRERGLLEEFELTSSDSDWACASCGETDQLKFKAITHSTIGEPADYDMECMSCKSLNVHETLQEAFNEVIKKIRCECGKPLSTGKCKVCDRDE